jgi:hypothetical protein
MPNFPVVYPEQFDPRTVRELFDPQNQHPNCSRTVRPDHRTVRELFDPTTEQFAREQFDPLAEQFANSATQLAISWLAYRVSLRTVGSLIRIQTSKFKGK